MDEDLFMAGFRHSKAPAVAAVAGDFGRDLDNCFARIERTVLRARARGAELVVFPESALGGYQWEAHLPAGPVAVAAPPALLPGGEEIARLAKIAGPTVVCAGYTEAGAGEVFSSAVCVTGDGVLGHQRKVHIPPTERGLLGAGEGFSAFDTPVGRMGMLVCYDKVFPEAARDLSLDGAEIVASLAAWPVCRWQPAARVGDDRQTRQFNLLDQARALENQVVWVSSNQAGEHAGVRFLGHAKIVDPDGTVLSRTTARPGMAIAGVDVSRALGDARTAYSYLGDRQPAAYLPPPAIEPPAALTA